MRARAYGKVTSDAERQANIAATKHQLTVYGWHTVRLFCLDISRN
jgi:hypothetical protein